MFKRNNYELRCVEEYGRFREALKEAVEPADAVEVTNAPYGFDDLPDDHDLGFTDSMMMHAGIGVSQVGQVIGIEAPVTLNQLHRRGEIFLYSSLGAAALFAAADASQRLF